jgi:mannose-6-phosphate isomerase-like protein (cupin superfamily)
MPAGPPEVDMTAGVAASPLPDALPVLQPQVLHPRETLAYDTPERCRILESANRPDDPACSIARATVAPGVVTAWHLLRGTVERYLMVSGQGRVEVGDRPAETVGPGDVVLIPAGCRQRIANVGNAPLVFHAICTPRFRHEAYVDLENIVR